MQQIVTTAFVVNPSKEKGRIAMAGQQVNSWPRFFLNLI